MSSDTIDDIVRGACRRYGNRTAVDGLDRSASYQQLAAEVSRRASVLDGVSRLAPVDRIGLYAENSVDYVVSYLAVLRTGRVPFLMDSAFGAHEVEEIRTGCGVTEFLVDRAHRKRFPLDGTTTPVTGSTHDLVTVAETATPPAMHQDTAVCRFTSGSTGTPKCLEFSRDAVTNAAENWIKGTGLAGDDRTLCLATLTNGLAFNTSLLSSFLVGAELHLYGGLPTSARVVRALADSRATRLVAFPMVYRLLVEAEVPAERFADLHLAISAGAPLPAEVRSEFENQSRVRIADYYGIAETGPCTFERDPAFRRGLGTALPGVVLRTAGTPEWPQEVRVRSTSMATRYLNAAGLLERRLDAEGFYATEDVGYLKDDRLFVTGRIGGPVNLAGRKVDPREVEQAVRVLDGVLDSVVFADQGADGQVLLHAAVAADRPLRRADIVASCRSTLAPYKTPQKVTFVPEIPRSSSGKARMSDLKRLVEQASRDSSSEARST